MSYSNLFSSILSSLVDKRSAKPETPLNIKIIKKSVKKILKGENYNLKIRRNILSTVGTDS